MTPARAKWFCTVALICAGPWARSEDFAWEESGPGLATTTFKSPAPLVFTVVRVELNLLGKDLALTTTHAGDSVVGLESLDAQLNALPKELGTPVAGINGDFFVMRGPAQGDPRGLQILRGELISIPSGPAAFWVDTKGGLHGDKVTSKLTVAWPGGGTNLAGLNEEYGTGQHPMVLFTPRMGALGDDRRGGPRGGGFGGRANTPPGGGPIRPEGAQDWTLGYSGEGPWLPLQVGKTYHAIARARSEEYIPAPKNMLVLSIGPDFLATHAELTNGMPITITAATEPDLSGVETALGSGPMLVREGMLFEVSARMSEQPNPRSAIGWNDRYFYLAVVDGRQPNFSIGTRLSEMADFMIQLGCQESLDLDGGQSSTLILNGEVINRPAQGPRQGVANGIAVLRRPASKQPETK